MASQHSNYEDQTNKLKKFLQDFENKDGTRKFEPILQEIANRSARVLEVDVQDVESYDEELGHEIRLNTRRYQRLLSDAVKDILPEPDGDVVERDVLDVLLEQRLHNREDQAQDLEIPVELKRRYEVRLMLRHEDKSRYEALRNVRSNHIGQLVTIRAMVARCSDVKPLAKVVTYTCEECGYETYQEVTGRNFMPLDKCKSPVCTQYNSNAKLLMQTRGSKFSKFQELKIQELPGQVPTGHIPRVMTVHLMGELTRTAVPGDEIELSGIFLPTPYTGYKAMKAGLTADTFLEATSVHRIKQRYEDYDFSDDLLDEINEKSRDAGTYAKLARSIAPEIWGHEDVKKALLLQLVGGCDRTLKDLRIRGDMHVCLMGDPGVAKSQLLKHVAKLAPRGVYTTGKGSSGVGLTASVIKDAFSGELMLEGGALVLADQGICCIDEFDKMEDSDRTAIHEVMEQQTVSIAKAGITTSLNARSSVLAAANPQYGRYNPRRTPSENINLPQALLSRFDILFLLMDKVNEDSDFALAKHVCHVHQYNMAPSVDMDEVFDAQFLRAYIAQAHKFQPFIPQSLSEYITSSYISMRCDEEESAARDYFFTTARTLLSILRLSQALARLRFAKEVEQGDVDEAIRLMYESKRSIYDEADVTQRSYDPMSTIFEIAKNLSIQQGEGMPLKISEVLNRAVMKGFKGTQVDACLENYENLSVWQVDKAAGLINFVEHDEQ